MKTITRRTALAASVTVPLLPVTAYATPADPAVEAYWKWRAAYDAREVSLKADVEDDTPGGAGSAGSGAGYSTCPV